MVLRFEPQVRGDGVGVTGGVFLDRATLQLRSRLPGGAWVPTTWYLRAPVPRQVPGRRRLRLGGWLETGGRVIAVRGRDGQVDSALTAALPGAERAGRY